MKVHVFTREQIETGIQIKPAYAVISIRNSGEPRAKVKQQAGLRDVLYLAFSGIDPALASRWGRKFKHFTPAQANKICAFVRRHKANVGAFVVHCERARSRSPAVAAAISEALGLDSRRFWQMHTPNEYVYHMVADAFDRGNAGSGNQE